VIRCKLGHDRQLQKKLTSFYSVITRTDYFRQSEDSHSGPSLTTHTPLWSTMDTPYFIATGSLGKAVFWPYTSFNGTCLLLQPPSMGILFIRQLGGNRTSPFNYHHTRWCPVHVSVGTTHTIYHYILATGVYSPEPTEPDTIARFTKVTCRGVEPPAIIGTYIPRPLGSPS